MNDFLYSQVNIKRHARKTYDYHFRTKYVLKTRKTFEAGMHFIHRGSVNTKEKLMPENEGMHFHYRDACTTGEDNDCIDSTIEDKTARKFGNQLWHTVNKVCATLFKDGVCPFKKYYRPED